MTNNPALSPDQLAAHCLLSEIRTRIAVQPLPYQYGVEARALESLWEIFALSRAAMKDYPGCQEFARLTTNMLNVDLRPVTAKWHRAYEAGLLQSKDGANEFRADLAHLQTKLAIFSQSLQVMAYGTYLPDEITPAVLSDQEIDNCFLPVRFGLSASTANGIANAGDINDAELIEIAARRKNYQIDRKEGMDAVGISLSGGGIRSATFCLGVVQVLAERGLLKDFDYMSTVSGGGYIGSFITSCVGGGKDFQEIGRPYGPDSEAIRHVRQNAKYLSATNLKQRWMMITGTVAGLLLNLTAPLCIIALLAWMGDYAATYLPASVWLIAARILGVATAVSLILYGIALRYGAVARLGSLLFSWGVALTLLAMAGFLMESGFLSFRNLLAEHWSVSGYVAVCILIVPSFVRFLPVFRTPAVRRKVLNGALIAVGGVVPFIAVVTFYLFRILAQQPIDTSSHGLFSIVDGSTILIVISAIFGVVAIWFLNVNLTGPHKLYRDQLAKTFVLTSSATSNLSLSTINSANKAPYHLINVNVNLPNSGNRLLRDRKGDFFVFSKHWSGAPSVGYVPTANWLSNGKQIDLATAMAISGAAASPQMGKSSLPSLSAMMTLLNIRLGFWIKNPKISRGGIPGFRCLLREMTGMGMAENSPWLNLSDGGHIENMGIYELLRRRCKFVVCVDGEADPRSTFEGQLTLVRHAQIDFGIQLEPRLDDIRLDPESKFSRAHSHLFRIHYPAGEPDQPAAIGLMLYLKLSLTGDEGEILKRYHTTNPEFPHQSTLDQFYDEEQFEAYRQLGVHVAQGTFSPALLKRDVNPTNVSAWFRQLAENMLEPEGG